MTWSWGTRPAIAARACCRKSASPSAHTLNSTSAKRTSCFAALQVLVPRGQSLVLGAFRVLDADFFRRSRRGVGRRNSGSLDGASLLVSPTGQHVEFNSSFWLLVVLMPWAW